MDDYSSYPQSSDSSESDHLSDISEDEIVEGIMPYCDELLAEDDREDGRPDTDDEVDIDGLKPSELESRFENIVKVDEW